VLSSLPFPPSVLISRFVLMFSTLIFVIAHRGNVAILAGCGSVGGRCGLVFLIFVLVVVRVEVMGMVVLLVRVVIILLIISCSSEVEEGG
jgi:hypothetical protein